MTAEKQHPKPVVGVIVYNDKGEIFLGKAPKWNGKWIVPGGHIDWGETMAQCAVREVKEETNMDIEDVELIGVAESIFSKEHTEERHMIFLNCVGRYVGGDIILNDEFEEFGWFVPQKAVKVLSLNASSKKFIEEFIEWSSDEEDDY